MRRKPFTSAQYPPERIITLRHSDKAECPGGAGAFNGKVTDEDKLLFGFFMSE
jgi:hypothetical protein